MNGTGFITSSGTFHYAVPKQTPMWKSGEPKRLLYTACGRRLDWAMWGVLPGDAVVKRACSVCRLQTETEIPEDCILPLRECFGYDARTPVAGELEALHRARYLRLSVEGERALKQIRRADEEESRKRAL
jgi:hypothetical protein